MSIRRNRLPIDLRIHSLEPLVLMSASIEGSDAGEWLSGTGGDDVVAAGGGNDEIYTPMGRNFIDGGSGIDTLVIYEGGQNDFDVTLQRNGSVLVEGIGLDGKESSSTLRNVERISFTDGIVNTAELQRPNLAPIVNGENYVLDESLLLTGNVLANDVDPDGDALTAEATQLPKHGLLTIREDGRFAYLRTSNFAETDFFEYTVHDASGESVVATVEIRGVVSDSPTPADPGAIAEEDLDAAIDNDDTTNASSAPNVNPFSVDDSFDVQRGETLFANVRINDGDSDGADHELVFELVDDATSGELNFYSDGSFDYWANETEDTVDTFQYQVSDIDGGTSYSTVTLGLPEPLPTPELPDETETDAGNNNDADTGPDPTDATDTTPEPTVADVDSAIVTATIAGQVSIRPSSTDADLPATFTEYTSAQSGTVIVNQAGEITYQADVGFQGIDFFHYVISDGENTDRATAVIHVDSTAEQIETGRSFLTTTPGVATPIVIDLNNDGVIGVTGETTAKDKSNITSIGTTVEFDIDGDGTLNTIEWVDGNGDGILVDTSKFQGRNIDGDALFGDTGGQYQNGYEKLALLDIDGNGLLETGELSSLKLWIDDGDANLESGELATLQKHRIFALSTQMAVNSEGLMKSWAYTNDDFRLMTEDVWFAEQTTTPNDDDTDSADNESPDADPDVFTGKLNTKISGNVISNDRDADGDTLSLVRHTRPIHGVLTIDDNGTFSYTPDSDFVGNDYFQYEISDGNGGTDTAVAMLSILGEAVVAGPGTANSIGGTIWEDSNRNGLRELEESGRGSSVFVSLMNSTGTILQSVHTNNNGNYSFDGIADGAYRIRVSGSSLPGFGPSEAAFTLRDVNSNFFDEVDSDVNRSKGESAIITFDADSPKPAIIVDAGYFYA